jgi:hypothetical protein
MPTFEATNPNNTSVTFKEGSNDNAGLFIVATIGRVDESTLGQFLFDNPKANYVVNLSGVLHGAEEVPGGSDSTGFYIGSPNDTVSLEPATYYIKYHVDELSTE